MLQFLKGLWTQKPADADRRRSLRVAAPPNSASISVGGAAYPIKNWSRYGFLAGGYGGSLVIGDRCTVSVEVRQEPFAIVFTTEADIVRRDGDDIAGRFISVPPDSRDQIESYFAYHSRMA